MENIHAIIWDWNGTLLNDIDICIETINYSLTKRNLPPLNKDKYREIFTFPVMNYYEKAGFDFSKDSFDDLSVEFLDLYLEKMKDCELFCNAESVIMELDQMGYDQFILSAMEQESLIKSIRQFGIEKYFRMIKGIDDIYAHGKLDNGKELVIESGFDPLNICLIGDTLHDLEVARQVGCQCLLIAAGHQSYERLRKYYSLIIKDIKDVVTLCDPVDQKRVH
ncbi:MAG: HAD family hydrolase [Bacteroidales bacterium]|nr:MAG: HAD family hydrolase [Bacteroidales bacterium]